MRRAQGILGVAEHLPETALYQLRRGVLEHLVHHCVGLKVTKSLAHDFGLRRMVFRRNIDRMIADGAAFNWSTIFPKTLVRRNHHIVTLSLSDDELATLVFSLRGTSFRGSTNSDMRDATLILAEILRQANPMTRGYRLPSDLGRASPPSMPVVLEGDGVSTARTKALIEDAITRWRKLLIHYTDQTEARTERLVWPFTTTYHGSCLVAWCELRQGFRHFRIDQIARPEVTLAAIPRLREDLLREWRSETGRNSYADEEED